MEAILLQELENAKKLVKKAELNIKVHKALKRLKALHDKRENYIIEKYGIVTKLFNDDAFFALFAELATPSYRMESYKDMLLIVDKVVPNEVMQGIKDAKLIEKSYNMDDYCRLCKDL